LATNIAGKNYVFYRFSMYHDTVQLNELIIKKETLDFHRGRPIATVG